MECPLSPTLLDTYRLFSSSLEYKALCFIISCFFFVISFICWSSSSVYLKNDPVYVIRRKALCFIHSCFFFVLSFICWSSSQVYLKNDPLYLIRRTDKLFISLVRFLRYRLVSSSFLVLLRNAINFFSILLVWWFGLVWLFNSISTIFRLFNPKAILLEVLYTHLQHHNDTIIKTDAMRLLYKNIYLSLYLQGIRKGCVGFYCKRELETEHKL